MPENKKNDDVHVDSNLDLGFGGLFKGLGDFLDLISDKIDVVEHLERHESGSSAGGASRGGVNRTGEFRVKGMGDKARGVYGFSVRTGAQGMPKVERFGNIRRTEDGPVVADVREPLVDLFDEEGEILLVAELPGVDESEISVELHGDVLSLETSGACKFAREILLPAPVEAESLQKTYRNGILELRLRKAA